MIRLGRRQARAGEVQECRQDHQRGGQGRRRADRQAWFPASRTAEAAARTAWSEPVIVARNGLDYAYRLPETWTPPGNDEAVDMLRIVAAELRVGRL